MTKDQIIVFEYCKKYLQCISDWKGKLPFKNQQHGCGSSSPRIEHILESIHWDMFHEVEKAMDTAANKVQKLIDGI